MDVTSLYTNIPHDEGIEACREVWNNRINQRPSTESFIQLLEHVLNFNNFMFNGEHFLQISGTAMGTKMAPSYANIFMGRLERRLLYHSPTKPRVGKKVVNMSIDRAGGQYWLKPVNTGQYWSIGNSLVGIGFF
jgi:hypothetical protein